MCSVVGFAVAAEAVVLAAVVVEVDAVVAVAVDAVVAVEDMSAFPPGTPANRLQTGCQLFACFGQLLARLLQSVADFLRENTAINQRSKRRQNGGHSVGRSGQNRGKGQKKVS
ncbi:MAG: hypothetical protein ISQ73_04975 [Verrucomicrobiae bacterium]|nr:hypothetical protein [Verrucomicrobiae bacterium]